MVTYTVKYRIAPLLGHILHWCSCDSFLTLYVRFCPLIMGNKLSVPCPVLVVCSCCCVPVLLFWWSNAYTISVYFSLAAPVIQSTWSTFTAPVLFIFWLYYLQQLQTVLCYASSVLLCLGVAPCDLSLALIRYLLILWLSLLFVVAMLISLSVLSGTSIVYPLTAVYTATVFPAELLLCLTGFTLFCTLSRWCHNRTQQAAAEIDQKKKRYFYRPCIILLQVCI